MQYLDLYVSIILTVFTILVKWFFDWIRNKYDVNETEKEAIQTILEGMAIAQDTFVREAKMYASDGKLSADEISQAKKIAWEYTLAAAKGPVKDLIISWGKPRVESIIKQLLSKETKIENVTSGTIEGANTDSSSTSNE